MPLPQNHRPSSPQSASQNHSNQRPAPFAAPTTRMRPPASQRPTQPRRPVQQQSATIEEPANDTTDNNMSFDFDDDGFEMSSEPVNPAAPMQSPANQAYIDRRKNEMMVNARNPFSVPNPKSDSIPAPLAAPRPAPSYNPPKEDENEPTIEDTENSITPDNTATKVNNKKKPEPTMINDNNINTVNTDYNAGTNTNTVSTKDEGADFGAISMGLASSTILITILTLSAVIGIKSNNYNIIKYAVSAALILIPLLALIASIIAFTKHHGSKIAAIVGAVLAVFTLGVGGYAYMQADTLKATVSNQVSQKVQEKVKETLTKAFSTPSDNSNSTDNSGSTNDSNSQSEANEPSPSSSSESDNNESSYYPDDSVSVSPDTTDDSSQSASSDGTTDSTTVTPDAGSSAQAQN